MLLARRSVCSRRAGKESALNPPHSYGKYLSVRSDGMKTVSAPIAILTDSVTNDIWGSLPGRNRLGVLDWVAQRNIHISIISYFSSSFSSISPRQAPAARTQLLLLDSYIVMIICDSCAGGLIVTSTYCIWCSDLFVTCRSFTATVLSPYGPASPFIST